VRRRLILSTALIALAAVIVLGVPLALVEAARVRQDSSGRLEREADAVAAAIDDLLEAHQAVSPTLLARHTPAHHRIVVTTTAGRTIASGPPLAGDISSANAGSSVGGQVVAQAPAAERDARIHRVWLLIVALSAGGVLAAVALAALQARRLARPLEAIARRSEQLGDGDFSVRAGRFGIPEIDAIAGGLDSSAERIAELVAREREFQANVSHQLRTPLTALRLRLEEAQRGEDPDVTSAELEAALREADRLETTIAALIVHARQGDGRRRTATNLGVVATEHVATWRPMFARAGRTIELASTRNVLVMASPGTVGQVVDVLLENALRHGGGAVRAEVALGPDGRNALLTVGDAGPGIDERERGRIFERGASRSGGTGIGLHLARALLQADGGRLELAPGPGTTFVLTLASIVDRTRDGALSDDRRGGPVGYAARRRSPGSRGR
jgi:signal transduction histidine kinase